jgi:hypothetical protein
MRISIRHQLSVTPPPGTANAVLQLLLTPLSGPTQTVESWSVEMAGIGSAGRFTDAFGNVVHLVNQSRPEGALEVTATGVVRTSDRHGVLGRVGGEPVPALYKRITPLTKASASLYGKFRGSRDSRLDVLHGLMARVGELLGTEEPSAQGQSQMAADGSQSQSQGSVGEGKPHAGASGYAHAFIGGARALDIPARYVTGFLVGAEDGQSSFHAWALIRCCNCAQPTGMCGSPRGSMHWARSRCGRCPLAMGSGTSRSASRRWHRRPWIGLRFANAPGSAARSRSSPLRRPLLSGWYWRRR